MGGIGKLLRDLVVTPKSLDLDEVETRLWNIDVRPADSAGDQEHYRNAILEQYRIYVEMADRISARRALANTFFLTLNTAILTAIGVFWNRQPGGSDWALIVPLIVLIGQCVTWYLLIRSYRQLNAGK